MNRLQFLKKSILAAVGIAAGTKAIAEAKPEWPLAKLDVGSHFKAIDADKWKWEYPKPITEYPFYEGDVIAMYDNGQLSELHYRVNEVNIIAGHYGAKSYYLLQLITPDKGHPNAMQSFKITCDSAHLTFRKVYTLVGEYDDDKPGIGGEQFKVKLESDWFKPINHIKPFLP